MEMASWECDLVTGELWWSDNGGLLVGRPAGFTPRDLNDAFGIVIDDTSRPRDTEEIIAALKDGPIVSDRQMVLPDGSTKWLRHRYQLAVDGDGTRLRLVGIMVDVDHWKQRELEESGLARAGEVLNQSLNVPDTLRAVAEVVIPDLADWCVIELLEDGQLRPALTAHVDPEKVRWAEAIQAEYPQDMDSPIGPPNVVRTGKTEFYPVIPDEMLVAVSQGDDRMYEILSQVGYRSVVVVPLMVRGEVLGTLTMVMADSGRKFTEQSVRFAERLALYVGPAIGNSRLHADLVAAWEGQRRAVETLQRGLTPDPLTEIPGLTLAVEYEMGGEAKVGGDWYDAFTTATGEIALVVGDVVGSGVPAVAAMTRYRNGLKALLASGHRPGEALSMLNRTATSEHPTADDGFATVICMCFDPVAHTLTWARAGHPFPMLRQPDGTVVALRTLSDPPLGVKPDHQYSEDQTPIAVGSTLVLYSDGLIERRGEDIDTSTDRLVAEMAVAPTEPAELVRHLLDRLPAAPATDDAAVLVVRFDR
jgi:serine phosphatase RsbU (regulator of sigma subunit)